VEIQALKGDLADHFTVFDPYTISEKKLDYVVNSARRAGKDEIQYEVLGKTKSIRVADLQPILADIDDQIIARDLMLVEQSEILLASYPCLDVLWARFS
jgi:hypothetical protein